jgi:hypothetical protein
MKTYRCGYCGNPCDENGISLPPDVFKMWTEDQWNNAEAVQGYCCLHEQESKQRMRVTRDMAIDACDLSLEGELI